MLTLKSTNKVFDINTLTPTVVNTAACTYMLSSRYYFIFLGRFVFTLQKQLLCSARDPLVLLAHIYTVVYTEMGSPHFNYCKTINIWLRFKLADLAGT